MNREHESGDVRRRAIRSYVVRGGRLTEAQQRALDELLPRYGVQFCPQPLNLTELFGAQAPCTMEIGFGNGDNLLALASSQAGQHFVGVEVHPPGVGHLLRQAAAAGVANLKVIQHDAVEVLQRQIAPDSLHAIVILFPDPWHKKRHHKRRLINPEFATLAASRLCRGGTLQLATDWEPYAEAMLDVLNAVPALRNRAPDGRFVPRNAGRVVTRFERRGERLGHAVHDLCYERI
jgi:tRNA (guanine-N7-)-methyltransferase